MLTFIQTYIHIKLVTGGSFIKFHPQRRAIAKQFLFTQLTTNSYETRKTNSDFPIFKKF